MKQILQNYRAGDLILADVAAPQCSSNRILVRNAASLVSAGTERQMIDLARKSLIGKALARPDLVKKVLAVAKTDGILEAYQISKSRLETPLPLGYSSAGEVIAVGEGVQGIKAGDRVACAGSGYACHAEIISVPRTLCVPIPDGVDNEAAAFVALGAIALHAVRMGEAVLGENIAIIGLGLLGLLAVQILKAAGCHVLGTEPSAARCELAEELGCEATATTPEQMQTLVASKTGALGCDAVLIFAATSSNQPVELAAEIVREQGRVVVPGLVGLDIPRKVFYEKELSLRISRAWGPGMYDPDYEAGKSDYPYAFVRWTAQRNMAAFLDLLAQDKVQVAPLITHRFPIEHATEAYELITKSKEPFIGVVLEYGQGESYSLSDKESYSLFVNRYSSQSKKVLLKPEKRITNTRVTNNTAKQAVGAGLIGAGNFAKATLLPVLSRAKKVRLRGIATATGASSQHAAEKFGFDYCTTDSKEILNDPDIHAVLITTRHNSHGPIVAEALRARKHVFVEKPLCLTEEELEEIRLATDTHRHTQTFPPRTIAEEKMSSLTRNNAEPDSMNTSLPHSTNSAIPLLMVGFNRRFSPFTVALKEWLSFSDLPMVIHCRANAGFVPLDRWEQDPEVGGGRIVGEVCHFVDLIQYLTDAFPVEVYAQAMRAAGQYLSDDNMNITLKMSDGSVVSITYTACGDKSFPRERVEVFRGGAVGLIENFKMASLTYQGRTRRKRSFISVDRGHRAEIETFLAAACGEVPPPVALEDYVSTTLTTFRILDSLREGRPVAVNLKRFKR